MTSRAVVERAISLWNNHDREGYIACFAEDCEFNVPRVPGEGRAARLMLNLGRGGLRSG